MALPDTIIEERELPSTATAPTDTGVGFAVITSDKGPVVPTLCRNLNDVVAEFGGKVVWSGHYDGADVFFRELGYALYLQRAVGPGASFSTGNLLDAGALVSLVATDKVGPGSSSVTIDILDHVSDPVLVPVAGHFRIRTRYNGTLKEDSGDLTSRADAVAWSANSKLVSIALGASALVPAAALGVALAGGADDHASVGTTQLQTAIDKFDADLGPGQVAIPGQTSDAVHDIIVAHAKANNRTYVLDLVDSANDATLRTAAAHVRGLGRGLGSDKGGIFAPWDVAPGDGGTSRVVPASWRQMATSGRNDAAGMSPNQPAAGDNGQAVYCTGVSQKFTKAQRQALNEAGVNVSIIKNEVVTTYGYRTPVDQTVAAERKYSMLSNQRMDMALRAEYKVIEDAFQFSELDGFRRNIGRFASQIDAVNLRWKLRGSIPGYVVDAGPTVNTKQTMAAGELRAETTVQYSPFNERTIIGIARVPVEETI